MTYQGRKFPSADIDEKLYPDKFFFTRLIIKNDPRMKATKFISAVPLIEAHLRGYFSTEYHP